jgi:hypothetical protein
VGKSDNTSQQAGGLIVAVDLPSARILADQASVVADLELVMDCCKRLIAELTSPDADQEGAVPVALWSTALLAYARCFGAADDSGLTVEDVRELPLQGAVVKFHEWIIGERDKLTGPAADPFDAAKVGAVLTPPGRGQRRVEGIAVFAASRVLIDVTGVGQLGGLASELAKRIAGKAQKQQDAVLSDAQQLDIGRLYESPSLLTGPPPADAP